MKLRGYKNQAVFRITDKRLKFLHPLGGFCCSHLWVIVLVEEGRNQNDHAAKSDDFGRKAALHEGAGKSTPDHILTEGEQVL